MYKKINKSQKGYTLIELLAVIIILVTVGALITSILVTSLRGGNKSNNVNDVRQNGNYIVSQMSKMIAYSRSFDGVSTDGVNYVNDCTVVQPPAPTPSIAPVAYSYIKITSFDGGQTVFSCTGSSIASNGASLTNTTNLNVSSCSFYCSQTNVLAPPTVNINFSLSKINSGFFVENQTTIPFETSVTPRN
jgi:prepilin-type N-terminal cleavage/methylation domain-containing protein